MVADVFDGLATLEDSSVDLMVSSPPFLALRSYLPADHPDKGKEIGSEATPADYLDTLLDVVEACARVLAPHGSLVFEIGDTFSGSGGGGGDYAAGGFHDGQPVFDGSGARERLGRPDAPRQPRSGRSDGWPLDKSLTFIPQLFGASLAYGRNLLRPERETERWRIRNVVAWCRPNPPVGALGDKFRPATSYLTVATKAQNRWFDGDAVRGERSPNTHARAAKGVESLPRSGKSADRDGNWDSLPELAETAGAPLLDYWVIPTQPYKGSHYATWPEALVVPIVLSMCPEKVCRTCGEPSRRIVRIDGYTDHSGVLHTEGEKWSSGIKDGSGAHSNKPGSRTTTTTLGWTDCDCSDDRNPSMGLLGKWRPGVVLDPFAGSGTTGQVATRLGRAAVLIDIDSRNADLARERIGLFFDESTTPPHGLLRPSDSEDGSHIARCARHLGIIAGQIGKPNTTPGE
jgi:site-specific DNA-methyltransferase (adenine-specific)